MRVMFLTNNNTTSPLVNWLRLNGADVALTGEKLAVDMVRDYSPAWILSYNYRHIIKREVLDLCPGRFLNFHVSLLPWNRGADPNLWSFLEDTPKGVTIHLIDKGVDTGPVLLSEEMRFDPQEESLETSYIKLQKRIQGLFRENWGQITAGRISPRPQPAGGSRHLIKDSEEFKRIVGNDLLKLKCFEVKKRYAEFQASLKR